MNAQEYTVAYNKITSHKEFEDAQFTFEFVTQQCAILLVAASNPAEYMKSFWEAVDRKVAMATDAVEDQKFHDNHQRNDRYAISRLSGNRREAPVSIPFISGLHLKPACENCFLKSKSYLSYFQYFPFLNKIPFYAFVILYCPSPKVAFLPTCSHCPR